MLFRYSQLGKGFQIVCHSCGSDLSKENICRFYDMIKKYRTVMPACSACSDGPDNGWIIRTPFKSEMLSCKVAKRKKIDFVNVESFKPVCQMQDGFTNWLADSRRQCEYITKGRNAGLKDESWPMGHSSGARCGLS